jgi:hypothetical protein
MQRRTLFLALVAGVFLWGMSALEARAATTLADLIGPPVTDFTNGDKVFSNFAYSGPTPPSAAQVDVLPFNLAGPPAEVGMSFIPSPPWVAPAGTSNMWTLSYDVHANGGAIFDAFLGIKGSILSTGGSVTVTETITSSSGATLGTLSAFITSSGTQLTDTVLLSAAAQDVHVTKTFDLVGGTFHPSVLLQVDQGYSQLAVPEPTSVALLGIGMTGFFALRRFFKRTSVA